MNVGISVAQESSKMSSTSDKEIFNLALKDLVGLLYTTGIVAITFKDPSLIEKLCSVMKSMDDCLSKFPKVRELEDAGESAQALVAAREIVKEVGEIVEELVPKAEVLRMSEYRMKKGL